MRYVLLFVVALATGSVAINAQSTTFPDVVYATVPTGSGPIDLRFDLVVPLGAGPFPVVVWVHGGGWASGSRLPIPNTALRQVARGYAVASIDYRLSGEALWPAQIQDCKAAIRALRANAATWNLDPDRIGVMGSSAGGHLVTALATMGDVGTVKSGAYVVDLEGTVGNHVATSSRVQCAIDQYGPTNMLLATDSPTSNHDAPTSAESLLVGGALQDNAEKWATVDPIPFLSRDDPEILAMHGTSDTVVPFFQSELLVRAAKAIGHRTTLFPVPNEGHGGPGFSTNASFDAIDAFLDRTLRDLPPVTVSISATDPMASESGDPASFLITRSGSTLSSLSVELATSGDIAVGVDCDPLPLLVVIPAGQSSVAVPFTTRQDALAEGNESLTLHLAPTDAYRIDHSASSATAVITDDDVAPLLPLVSVVPLDAQATEIPGNPGAIRLQRTGDTSAQLTVHYDILGTATNGSDYAPLSGSATFAAGSATTLVIIAPLNDTQREPTETVVLRLRPGTDHARGATTAAHVLITDDERNLIFPVVGVLGTGRKFGESFGTGEFRITRRGALLSPVTVALSSSGTAVPGVDYVPLPATVTIPAGAGWVLVPVQPLDDGLLEGEESITLTALPAANVVLGAASSATLWIDDDEAPTASPSPVLFTLTGLSPGHTSIVTLVGGAPSGAASLWVSLSRSYVPLAPYGIIELDLGAASAFLGTTLDVAGASTFEFVVPDFPSLAGTTIWWQALATTATSPFLALTNAQARTIQSPRPF